MAIPFVSVAVSALGTGIGSVISLVRGWFGSGGVLAVFFGHLGVKITAKGAAIAWQIASIIALGASRVAFGVAVFEISRLIYNYINFITEQIPTLMTQNEIMTLAYTFMRSVGLISALNDAFVVFNVFIVAIFVAFFARFIYHSVKLTADEYFKLSVLIQQ